MSLAEVVMYRAHCTGPMTADPTCSPSRRAPVLRASTPKLELDISREASAKCCQAGRAVIHAHVTERLDSTNKQNAPRRVHMYTYTRVYINVYAYIYTDIHIYIYIHVHMHLYTHTCTHIYIRMHMHTYAKIKNLSNNASTCQAIS